MKKLQWWFRIVGVFYLLLTVMNIWALFLGGSQLLTDTLPAPMNADALAVSAFSDAWMVFVFELGALGIMALVAARRPAQSRIMAWVIILAELFRGVVADAIWIGRGYAASSYIGFIVIHLLIMATGVLFLRQAQASHEAAQLGMAD
ncbi:MAG: BphX family protein [Ardenticatenaceae bacterium]|nr:BphX family protein [Anaerolineales bacterium]MCB8938726.1 BphX family protein [Ardenticatenaceae bacterium]MCB8973962.1 BphX family protein [Ardenticatenaceae bacterium]